MNRSLLVLSAALALASCGDAEVPRAATVGEPAPAYAATTLDGDSISLAHLRGKPVLLNVWATWCHPCREEIPALQALHEKYAPQGLEVVGVSVDADGEEAGIREFARDIKMTYPIWLDPEERVSSTFRLMGVPSTFLIDRQGQILWKHLGPVKFDDPKLQAALQKAL